MNNTCNQDKRGKCKSPRFEHLPRTVIPTNYNLQLHPYFDTFTFTGFETISVVVQEAGIRSIKLNCVDIEIQNVQFSHDQVVLNARDVLINTKDETLSLIFEQDLPVGTGNIDINFTGRLNDKLRGFYRSSCTASDGVKRHMAVTQFCPTDARRAFPCWDEPAIKATFDVTLVCAPDDIAISNMPAVKEEVKDGLKVTTFSQSPIMSTYLLVFVVGQFDYVEKHDVNNVLIRVYTPIGKKEQGKFALDLAVKTLPFYDKYFEIPYPLPKLDLIAVPDFAFGAMENWGLVTYRETALLVNPEHASSSTRQRVGLIVGHELAHQWFGNLVTMQWWTHLWLNEGFASWIEYLCVDHSYPDWKIWLQYIDADYKGALKLDALETSHAIEVPVAHPDEIGEIFDAVSYDKSSCIIRMLHNWLGGEIFRKGLAHYLHKHKYQNTVTEDLWQSLEEISSKPVYKVMTTWTSKMGYPLLEVDLEVAEEAVKLRIKQQKFSSDCSLQSDYEWLVPVTVVTQSNSIPQTFLLDKPQECVVLEGCKAGDWIKVNTNQVGLYRVKYNEDLLSRILPVIRTKQLPAADRLGIQDDMFASAKAGYSATTSYLDLLRYYTNETNYIVICSIADNLDEISSVFSHLPDIKQSLVRIKQDMFSKILDKLGLESLDTDTHTDTLLRGITVEILGKCGVEDVVGKCYSMFTDHISGKRAMPSDIRTSVYSTVRQSGKEDHFDQLLSLFDETDLVEEKDRIQNLLGDGPNVTLRAKTLAFAMGDKVRPNDTHKVIKGVASSGHEGRVQAWNFLKDNFTTLSVRCSGGTLLQSLIKSTCSSFCDMELYRDIQQFFSYNKVVYADRAIKQSLENVKIRAAWLIRDRDTIISWAKNQE